MPADVLWVTGGQDHGARFALHGSSATIGRGPVMDIVLTDSRVSRRHARLRVDGMRLLVEDLSSGGGTAVNGVVIDEPTSLALGDRLTVGGTELTVAWTPSGSLVRPAPAPRTPPPAARPAPVPRTMVESPPARPAARPALLLPIACLALTAFSVLALWMPVLGDPSRTNSIWELRPSGLRMQALAAALLTAAAAGLWLGSVAGPRPGLLPTRALAAATAAGGGLMAGLPLFLAAVDLPGVSAEAGLVLLALAGVAIAACGVAGTALDPGGPAVGTPDAAALTILAGGGGIGSVLAVAACPLAWISFGDVELGGLDRGVGAGGWLIPLALAVAAGCGLTAAVARTGDARRVVPVAAGSTALAAAAATFATTAAIVFRGYRMETGLSLVLAGTAIAVVSTGFGTAALCLRGPAPRDAAGAEMPGADQRW